ncbi:hypothetical protein ACHAXR_009049, partial [Thalassiosira sp. AJA248-18]
IHHHHYANKRYFSISRHLDPLAQHGTINKLEDDGGDIVVSDDDGAPPVTADDLEGEFWNEGGGGGGGGSDYSDIFGTGLDGDDDDKDDDELDAEAQADAAYQAKQAEINAALDKRTGRLWTDEWIITDEEWMSQETLDDIEEWKPSMATRKSIESVKVFEGGVPTLQQLSDIENLPPPLPPHPGNGDPTKHAKYRKRQLKKRLQTAIQLAIYNDLREILKMTSWDDKQEAVDGLFEVIEERVREREPILGKLPEFPNLVEGGLEDVLRMAQDRMRGAAKKVAKKEKGDDVAVAASEEDGSDDAAAQEEGEAKGTATAESLSKKEEEENVEEIIDVMGVNKEPPVPVFMDILAAARKQQQSTSEDDETPEQQQQSPPPLSKFFTQSNKDDVPNLIYPLNVHHNEGCGRMLEEWQLAANKETKRIMMRDATKQIASKIVEAANCCGGEVSEDKKGAARVFVAGQRGVGKTAALAGIVASARISGHIVVYLPDGDRLRKHGFYNEPCNFRKGLYNLPEIAKEFCEQLLTSHGDDLEAMPPVSKEAMKDFLSEDHIKRLFKRAYKEDDSVSEEDVAAMTELSLEKLLTVGIGSSALSSGCYCTVINTLMNQKEKPFTVVMDEFNVYYDHGHYFHMDYDEDVKKAIPLNRITIFKPFLDAMGLYPTEAGTEMTDDVAVPSSEAMMKWGSIIVGTSERRAVKQSFTRALTDAAHALSKGADHPMHVVDIQRFSNVEVQHILYNFEITGIGRLRFDRGDTALNPEEVEYLRLVSGGSGQQLMDACMVP